MLANNTIDTISKISQGENDVKMAISLVLFILERYVLLTKGKKSVTLLD